jgi:NtrC-family two-component system response regulator AlgB
MRILIVDDEENIRRTTSVALQGLGHEVLEASNPPEALTQVGKSPELIFLDLRLGGSSGLELIPELLELSPGVDIIVFTAYASIETAVESMRAGAVDFLEKPFTPEQLRLALGKRAKVRKLQARVVTLETALATGSPTIDLGTEEPAMAKVYELCFRVSATPAAVLLLGESGTGKSVLARAIHEHSPRKAQPEVYLTVLRK